MYGDEFMLALAMWREARGDGAEAMKAVGCVIRNRVLAKDSAYYREVVRPLQFSSVTYGETRLLYEYAPTSESYKAVRPFVADPETVAYPIEQNAADWQAWLNAIALAPGIIGGEVQDNTSGATSYYATTIAPPTWAQKMTETCRIGRQVFYKE